MILYEDSEVIIRQIQTKQDFLRYSTDTKWNFSFEEHSLQNTVIFCILRKIPCQDSLDKVIVLVFRKTNNNIINTQLLDSEGKETELPYQASQHLMESVMNSAQSQPMTLLAKVYHHVANADEVTEAYEMVKPYGSHDWIYYVLIENPNMSMDTLKSIIRDPKVSENVRSYVAKHCSFTSILEELSTDVNYLVRECVAENASTPVPILEKLAEDKNVVVRCAVARHRNTPEHILEKLSTDVSYLVRKYVAENTNATVSLLEKLAKDKHSSVRYQVANNRNTPDSVLQKMHKDEDPTVRESVASHPNASVETLKKLADDRNSFVKNAVAVNPNAPISILMKLSNA